MKKTSKKFIIFGLLCLFFATNSIGSSPALGRYNTIANPKNYQPSGGKANYPAVVTAAVAVVATTYFAVYEAGRILGKAAYYFLSGNTAVNDVQSAEFAYYNATDFSSYDAKN